jgi:F420H(2)-dependent quinone reductase
MLWSTGLALASSATAFPERRRCCCSITPGPKSGTARTSPLVYIRDGENLVLVASKGGYPKTPAWFHNLSAHPDTPVQVGSRRIEVRARVANATERRRLWPEAVKAYSGYESYQRHTEREIPLVILEPR